MDLVAFNRFCARSGISRLVLAHPLVGRNKFDVHGCLPLRSLPVLRNLRHLVLGSVYHFAQVQTLEHLEPLYNCTQLETLAVNGLTFDHDVSRLTTIRLDRCIVQYKPTYIYKIKRERI